MSLFSTSLIILLATIVMISGEAREEDITFYMVTQNTNSTLITHQNEDSIDFGDEADIIYLIHGWSESRLTPWYEELGQAYLNKKGDKDHYIIEVDWSKPASQNYLKACIDAPQVGGFIANFIADMIDNHNVDVSRIHVIGHSLGGQVAGFVGKALPKILSGTMLKRITALDPAGPLFAGYIKITGDHLKQTDAEIVVVIHTAGGQFGVMQPIGSTDIYPNGGTPVQPGCPTIGDAFCSHHRSYLFFIEAVNSGMFATRCKSYKEFIHGLCKCNRKINIGGQITKKDIGYFYLVTNPQPPFAVASTTII